MIQLKFCIKLISIWKLDPFLFLSWTICLWIRKVYLNLIITVRFWIGIFCRKFIILKVETKEFKKYMKKRKLKPILSNFLMRKIVKLSKVGFNLGLNGITVKLRTTWYYFGLRCLILLKQSPINCKVATINPRY